jgi:hypothetical protein
MIKRSALPLLVALCLTTASLAHAESVQSGSVRVAFAGKITPHTLPRQGKAPVEVSVSTKITASGKAKVPPQLTHLEIAINQNGVLDTTGLPVCPLEVIQPSTTQEALANCRRSLVGEGLFEAKVLLKGQASFPSVGKLYAFNSRVNGRPAILAHVYGTQPAPASFTLVFEVRKAKGTFGTVLSASLPDVTSGSGYVTGLSISLGKSYSYRGKRHSYLSAGCPAPKGFARASFPFARATLAFAGGRRVEQELVRSCGALG